MSFQTKKRLIIFGALLSFAISTTLIIINFRPQAENNAEEKIFFNDESYFFKADPRWADTSLGKQRTMQSHGAATLVLSMAMHALGHKFPPDELAKFFVQNDAYQEDGEPNWILVTQLSGRKLEVVIPSNPNMRMIVKSLQKERPVMAKLDKSPQSAEHWILIVGIKGRDFLVKDPFSPQQRLHLLSEYKSRISHVRILKIFPIDKIPFYKG